MRSSIILIGPYLSGKSTLRRLLAERLHMPECSLDPFEDPDLCLRLYREGGYDEEDEDRAINEEGGDGFYRYMKPFEAYAVERCLAQHPGHVVELGATHSVYEDEALLRRVEAALAPFPDVLLLLPSPDREESWRVLRERFRALMDIEFNEHYVKHHSSHDLATHTVYTEGRTPEQTRDEILGLLDTDDTPGSGIILVGPPVAGKSTQAELLAARLGLPRFSLDEADWGAYPEAGYEEELADRARREGGTTQWYRYMQPVWANAMGRLLAEHPGHIIDFGGGHAVYEDDALFEHVRGVMAPYEHVILLLPSPDLDESVRILKERPRTTIGGVDANRYLIEHPSNEQLAKRIVYTEGETPEETRDAILAAIGR